MKNYLLLLISALLLFSCTENDSKKDTETNTYYAKYKFIFENYDTLGIEKSIDLLDEYIVEFPNAINAYKFKAFLLAKKNNFDQIKEVLENNILFTTNETTLSNYHVSLLLLDTINLKQVKKINQYLYAENIADLETKYNEFWLKLYKNEFEAADSLIANILNTDTTNNIKYRRALFVSAAAAENFEALETLKTNDLYNAHLALIDSLINKQVSLQEYYQILSK